ncbi:MAG: hypothetical protein CL610_06025 [Anaerolineaceae bacterium]|nr:hypothetical protein [Anaerolineaceae bacterium]
MTQQARSTLSAAIDTSGANGTTGQEIRNIIDSAALVAQQTITATTHDLDSDDDYTRIDTTSNNVTINLPPLAEANNQEYTFKWVAGANTATLDGDSAEQIEGSNTYVFATLLDSVKLRPGPTQWELVSEFLNA